MGINAVDGLFSDEEIRPLLFNYLKPVHVEDSSQHRVLTPWRSNMHGISGVDSAGDLIFIPWDEVKIVWQNRGQEETPG